MFYILLPLYYVTGNYPLTRMRKQATLRISDTLRLYKNETAVVVQLQGGTLQQADNWSKAVGVAKSWEA